MCLVIDICCFGDVFNKNSKNHEKFKPVCDWVTSGKGRVIYGGDKYKKEIGKVKSYISILAEFNRRGLIIKLDDDAVNSIEKQIESKETDPDFDDPHIIAIVIESGCKIVCTSDKRSHKFIKKKKLYPKHFCRPAIYTDKRNKSMLSDLNITQKCK